MGLIRDDSKGIAISMDILLALIPLTLVLGIVAADTGDVLNLVQDSIYRSSIDRVGSDTLNALLETSGDPVNWERYGNPKVAGLAKYDEVKLIPIEGTIYAPKLGAIKESDIQKMIGNDYRFFLNITTEDRSRVIKSIGTYNSSAHDIVKIERLSLYAKLEIVSKLENAMRYTGNPITYTSPPNPFPTNDFYLEIYDYWCIVVNRGYDSATVTINEDLNSNNYVVKGDDFQGNADRYKTFVRKVPESYLYGYKNPPYNTTEFKNNLVTVRTVSNPLSSMDVYIIQAPKGTPESEIKLDNAKPSGCRVDFFIWTIR